MPPNAARASLEALPSFFSELFPTEELLRDAFELSLELEHAMYDCLYLALALRQDAALVTADAAFVTAAHRGGYAAQVRLLGTGEQE